MLSRRSPSKLQENKPVIQKGHALSELSAKVRTGTTGAAAAGVGVGLVEGGKASPPSLFGDRSLLKTIWT